MRPCIPVDRSCSERASRRGSLLTEMVVCTVLLGTVSAVMIPMLSRLIEQKKLIRYDTLCVVELDNVAHEVRSRTTAGRTLEELSLSPSFLRRYPLAKLLVEPLNSDGEQLADAVVSSESLNAVRITISRPGAPSMPEIVRKLVIWVPQSMPPVEAVQPDSSGVEVQP